MFSKLKKWEIESLVQKYTQKKPKYNFKIELGSEIVYQDDYGKYIGLKENYFFKTDKEIYIFDNHNKVVEPVLKKNGEFVLVHIDAHPDDAKINFEIPDKIEISKILEKIRISDYLDFLEKIGKVKKIYRFTQSWDFENLKVEEENFILNLDIDIFGFDGQVVDLELKIKKIIECWKKAEFVLIATSPGFIDQKDAKFLVELLVNYI